MVLGRMVILWGKSNNVVLLRVGRKKHALQWWHWLLQSSKEIGTMSCMQGRSCLVVSAGRSLIGWWSSTKGIRVWQLVTTTMQLAQEVSSCCNCWLTQTTTGWHFQVEVECLALAWQMFVAYKCKPAWRQRSQHPSGICQRSCVAGLAEFVDVVLPEVVASAKALKMNCCAAGHCKRLWTHQQRSQRMNWWCHCKWERWHLCLLSSQNEWCCQVQRKRDGVAKSVTGCQMILAVLIDWSEELQRMRTQRGAWQCGISMQLGEQSRHVFQQPWVVGK